MILFKIKAKNGDLNLGKKKVLLLLVYIYSLCLLHLKKLNKQIPMPIKKIMCINCGRKKYIYS